MTQNQRENKVNVGKKPEVRPNWDGVPPIVATLVRVVKGWTEVDQMETIYKCKHKIGHFYKSHFQPLRPEKAIDKTSNFVLDTFT